MIPEFSIKNRHLITPARHRLAVVSCALFVFYSGCSQTFVKDKLNLVLRPTPGNTYVMRILAEDKVSQGPQGQQIEIKRVKTTELGFDVNGVDDKDVTSIKVTFHSIREKITNPTGVFEYDYTNLSRSKDNPLAKIYNAMIGESFAIKALPNGEIVELDAEDMFGRMAEKIVMTEKATSDAEQEARNARIEEVKQGIKSIKLTSAEYLKELAGNIIPTYPGRTIGAGDSWALKVETAASQWIPFAFETDVTFTLKERRQGQTLVEVNSEKTLTDKSIPDSGGSASYTGNVTVEGNLEINEASGWLIAKKVKTQLEGDIKEKGKSMPVSIEKIITVESME